MVFFPLNLEKCLEPMQTEAIIFLHAQSLTMSKVIAYLLF